MSQGIRFERLLSNRRSLALLAFCALEARGTTVSVERVLATFWPDSQPEQARDSLTQLLYRTHSIRG